MLVLTGVVLLLAEAMSSPQISRDLSRSLRIPLGSVLEDILSPSSEDLRQSPPSNRSAVAGLQVGYQRFHANDSLIGQPVLCTFEEKLCFQFNMLFDSANARCVDMSIHNAAFSSGHLHAVRLWSAVVCAGYVMAYDDRCYRKEVVRDVICGCAAELTKHFLNGVECRCANRAAIQVQQPKENGKCLIPDLSFPNQDRSYFFRNPYERIQGFTSNQNVVLISKPIPHFNCSSEQLQCFSQGKVWVGEAGTCFPLLERGPCDEDHVVALDVQAALEGHVESTCTHVRGGCPPGHVRMPYDGNCHNQTVVEFTIEGKLRMNVFGTLVPINNITSLVTFQPLKLQQSGTNETNVCAVKVRVYRKVTPYSVSTSALLPQKRYEVIHDIPLPDAS